MSFVRYEIRTFYHNEDSLYDGDNFSYTPFDKEEDMFEYIEHNKWLLEDHDSYVCRVILHSNYDQCERLATVKEYYDKASAYRNLLKGGN